MAYKSEVWSDPLSPRTEWSTPLGARRGRTSSSTIFHSISIAIGCVLAELEMVYKSLSGKSI
jgi:hypothetical protein